MTERAGEPFSAIPTVAAGGGSPPPGHTGQIFLWNFLSGEGGFGQALHAGLAVEKAAGERLQGDFGFGEGLAGGGDVEIAVLGAAEGTAGATGGRKSNHALELARRVQAQHTAEIHQ